jgi:hypothetical protein
MARFGPSSAAWLLVDGFDLIDVTTDLREETEAILELSHTLGDSWQEHLPTGVQKAMLSTQGFFDDATASVNAALSGNQQTSRVVCYGVEGNTIGKTFVGLTGAFGAKYTRISSRGELHKAHAEYTVSGQKDNGCLILHALTAETATGNTQGANAQDNGASTSAGAVGYLQVTAISGTGATIDVKVRHSADNVTYVDLMTFTQVVLADGRKAERKTASGTVNRYLAVSWTIAGTSPSVTCLIGCKRL